MRLAGSSLAVAAGLAAAVAGYFALVPPSPANKVPAGTSAVRPVWTEVKWPFPIDQWGAGRAFACKATDCGAEVSLYLRAKLGSCNCTTGIAEDADLDRMNGEVSPLDAGRPIVVGSMKGRSRAYALTARNRPGKSALSVAFNDRCEPPPPSIAPCPMPMFERRVESYAPTGMSPVM
jgi:hypothetical protein